MSDVWIPRRAVRADRGVLYDGIPAHMREKLFEWIEPLVTRMDGYYGAVLNKTILSDYDVVYRATPPYARRASGNAIWPDFIGQLEAEELLDFVDWLVSRVSEDRRETVASLLTSASSAWNVGRRDGYYGLVRRVPEAVQAAADQAMSQGSAGGLLSEAWSACYSRSPNTEEAYEKAIKAVEEAACAAVSPKNLKATLGTMIRDMNAQGDWKLDLPGKAQEVPVSMMEALWTGQESRHGGNGYRVPTQSEAEAAVLLAVPLVQWFTSGAISRRP